MLIGRKLQLFKKVDQKNDLSKIGDEEFNSVTMLPNIRHKDAIKWRNGCVLYFHSFSKMPIPSGLHAP